VLGIGLLIWMVGDDVGKCVGSLGLVYFLLLGWFCGLGCGFVL